MNEKLLLLIAFIGAICGIFALFTLSMSLDYSEKTIEKMNSEKIEDMIKVQGEVASASGNGNVTFISIKKDCYLDVIAFGDANLNIGEKIEVIGKSSDYDDKKEIIAERIRVIG
jgi:hypothetical protein